MVDNTIPKGARGVLSLQSTSYGIVPPITVVGGPFKNKSPDFEHSVCLLEKSTNNPTVHMPIEDFSVPPDTRRNTRIVGETVLGAYIAAVKGDKVWVGCMGAYGRTGLLLALMAKVSGEIDPVAYVRKVYHKSAVETPEQEKYVNNFDVSGIRSELWKLALKYRIRAAVSKWLPTRWGSA